MEKEPVRVCIIDRLAIKLGSERTCFGKMTRHHIQFKSEGGSNKKDNLVNMCWGHQMYVHSKNTWGGEDFTDLRKK